MSLEEIEEFLENAANSDADEYLTQCREPIPDYLNQYTNQILGAFDELRPSLQKNFKTKKMSEQVNLALSKLNIKKREVVMRNFGIGEYEIQSLEDISKVLGVTRERVRVIRENALVDLKKNCIPWLEIL